MASVYENSYMIVLIFLLLGIFFAGSGSYIRKDLCAQINQVQKRRRHVSGIEPFMMQIFGFMLVIIFLLYCL